MVHYYSFITKLLCLLLTNLIQSFTFIGLSTNNLSASATAQQTFDFSLTSTNQVVFNDIIQLTFPTQFDLTNVSVQQNSVSIATLIQSNIESAANNHVLRVTWNYGVSTTRNQLFKLVVDNVTNPDQAALTFYVDVLLILSRSNTSNTSLTTGGNPVVLDSYDLSSATITNHDTCNVVGQSNCKMIVTFTPSHDVPINAQLRLELPLLNKTYDDYNDTQVENNTNSFDVTLYKKQMANGSSTCNAISDFNGNTIECTVTTTTSISVAKMVFANGLSKNVTYEFEFIVLNAPYYNNFTGFQFYIQNSSNTIIEKLRNVSCCSGLLPEDSSNSLIITSSEVTGTLNVNFTHSLPWELKTVIEISLPTKLSFVKNASNVIITTLSINSMISSGLPNAFEDLNSLYSFYQNAGEHGLITLKQTDYYAQNISNQSNSDTGQSTVISLNGIDFGNNSCPSDNLTVTVYNQFQDTSNGAITDNLKLETFITTLSDIVVKNKQPSSVSFSGELIGTIQTLIVEFSLDEEYDAGTSMEIELSVQDAADSFDCAPGSTIVSATSICSMRANKLTISDLIKLEANTTYTIEVENVQLPLFEDNFSAPDIKLLCNDATLDLNPGCSDCHYLTMTADFVTMPIRTEAFVGTGSLTKVTTSTTNGGLVEFEVSLTFDTSQIQYAFGNPTIVVQFEKLISSTKALSCSGVSGIRNITLCEGEDNVSKDGVFQHMVKVNGTFDESGTQTVRLKDMTAATSFAPLNTAIVGYSNNRYGIIAKQFPTSLNIVNQVNAIQSEFNVFQPDSQTQTVQGVEITLLAPFQIASDIQVKIVLPDTFSITNSTFQTRVFYGQYNSNLEIFNQTEFLNNIHSMTLSNNEYTIEIYNIIVPVVVTTYTQIKIILENVRTPFSIKPTNIDVLLRQKYNANYQESVFSSIDARVEKGLQGISGTLSLSVREIMKDTVLTFTIYPKNIAPTKGLKIFMHDQIVGKNLFNSLSVGAINCARGNSNVKENLSCEQREDPDGSNQIQIPNLSIISLVDQQTEDITKALRFTISGITTTDLSGPYDITQTQKIVDIDGGNDWIEEELDVVTNITFTCNPLSHCKVCESDSSNCISCDENGNQPVQDPNLYYSSGLCIQSEKVAANPIYAIVNGTLEPCSTTCKTCVDSPDTCTSCDINNANQLVNYDEDSNTCLAECPLGKQASDYVCTNCRSNCRGCTDFDTCTECPPEFPKIIPQTQGYKICDTQANFDTYQMTNICTQFQYQDSTLSPYCFNCQNNCQTCSDWTTCKSCTGVYQFNSDDSTCTDTCAVGKFKNSSNQRCSDCDANCVSCVTNIKCDRCNNPLELPQDENLPDRQLVTQDEDNAMCRNQTIALQDLSNMCDQNNSKQFDGSVMQCLSCKTSCSLCTSQEVCTMCKNGSYFQEDDCIDKCPEGWFGDDITNKCIQCPSTCRTCDSAKMCTDCNDNDSQFLTPKPNKTSPLEVMCELNEVAHQILSTYCAKNEQYVPLAFGCLQCDSSCASCSDSSTCTRCENDLYLWNTKCIENKPIDVPALYQNNLDARCEQCSTKCENCFDNSERCTKCKLWCNGTICINDNWNTIESCSTGCDLCDKTGNNGTNKGGDQGECTVCNSSLYNLDGFCASSCPDPWKLNEESRVCNKCDSIKYMVINEGLDYRCVLIPALGWTDFIDLTMLILIGVQFTVYKLQQSDKINLFNAISGSFSIIETYSYQQTLQQSQTQINFFRSIKELEYIGIQDVFYYLMIQFISSQIALGIQVAFCFFSNTQQSDIKLYNWSTKNPQLYFTLQISTFINQKISNLFLTITNEEDQLSYSHEHSMFAPLLIASIINLFNQIFILVLSIMMIFVMTTYRQYQFVFRLVLFVINCLVTTLLTIQNSYMKQIDGKIKGQNYIKIKEDQNMITIDENINQKSQQNEDNFQCWEIIHFIEPPKFPLQSQDFEDPTDELRFVDVNTKKYLNDQIMTAVMRNQIYEKMNMSFSNMSSLDLNLLNSKGMDNFKKLELDFYNAGLVNLPSDQEINRYRNFKNAFKRSLSTPLFRNVVDEYYNFVIKSHRSADDIDKENNDLEMFVDDEVTVVKKIKEPQTLPVNCEFNPDAMIVPKILEDRLIENKSELDPAYNVDLFLNDNKTIQKIRLILKKNNLVRSLISRINRQVTSEISDVNNEVKNHLISIFKDFEERIKNALNKNDQVSRMLIDEIKNEDQELLSIIKNINYLQKIVEKTKREHEKIKKLIDEIIDKDFEQDINDVRRLIEFENNFDQFSKLKDILNIVCKDQYLLEFIKKVKSIQLKQEKSHDSTDFQKLIKMRNDELVSKLTINKWNRKVVNRYLGIEILEEIKKLLSEFNDYDSILDAIREDKTREELYIALNFEDYQSKMDLQYIISNHTQIRFNHTDGFSSDNKFKNTNGIPVFSIPCMILETLQNPTQNDLDKILSQNETMKECQKSYRQENFDQCIATIDDFTTFKQMIKTVRLNVTVNNVLKIIDYQQRDDMLLNIHNEINDLFVNELTNVTEETISRPIDQSEINLKQDNAKSQMNSTIDHEYSSKIKAKNIHESFNKERDGRESESMTNRSFNGNEKPAQSSSNDNVKINDNISQLDNTLKNKNQSNINEARNNLNKNDISNNSATNQNKNINSPTKSQTKKTDLNKNSQNQNIESNQELSKQNINENSNEPSHSNDASESIIEKMKANETKVIPVDQTMQFRGSNDYDNLDKNAPSFMNKSKDKKTNSVRNSNDNTSKGQKSEVIKSIDQNKIQTNDNSNSKINHNSKVNKEIEYGDDISKIMEDSRSQIKESKPNDYNAYQNDDGADINQNNDPVLDNNNANDTDQGMHQNSSHTEINNLGHDNQPNNQDGNSNLNQHTNEPMTAEDEMMDEIIKEMGLDSHSILAQKQNVNSGKLVLKSKMNEQKSNGNTKHALSGNISTQKDISNMNNPNALNNTQNHSEMNHRINSVDRERGPKNLNMSNINRPASHQPSQRNSEENLVNINEISNQNISLQEEEEEFMKVRTDDTFMNKMQAEFHRKNQSNVNPLKILEKIREKKGSSPERKKVVNKAFQNNIMNSDFSKYKKTIPNNAPMSDGDIVYKSNNLNNEKQESKNGNVQSNSNNNFNVNNNNVIKLTSERNKKQNEFSMNKNKK